MIKKTVDNIKKQQQRLDETKKTKLEGLLNLPEKRSRQGEQVRKWTNSRKNQRQTQGQYHKRNQPRQQQKKLNQLNKYNKYSQPDSILQFLRHGHSSQSITEAHHYRSCNLAATYTADQSSLCCRTATTIAVCSCS